MGNLKDEFNTDDAQLKALRHVINEITSNTVPLLEMHELAARSTLRALQWQIDDLNALDDSELIDVLNQARIEIKYLVAVISDHKTAIKSRDNEIRTLQLTSNYQASEIQRLENQVFRDK